MSSNRDHGHDGAWIKASLSASGGECVEMRRKGGLVEVRDSKDQDGPVLRFARAEFLAWVDGASKGEFRHLANDRPGHA
jgi:hypothetical protein